MTYLLLFFLGLSFFAILKNEFYKKSTALVLWGGLFVFFYIPHSVDIILGPEEYTLATYNKASVFALFFNVLYFITRFFLSKIESKQIKRSTSMNLNIRFINVLFLLLVISVLCLLYFVKTTFGSLFNFTWIDIFDFRGGISYILYSYLFMMCIPLLFLAYKFEQKTVFFITLFIIIFIALVFRIRAYLIPITVPFILGYFFSERFNLKLINILKGLFFSFLIVAMIFALGVIKVYGTLDDFIATISFSDFMESFYFLFFSKYGELGLRNGFYFYIENNNNFENFGLGLGYVRLMMLPIPSFLTFGIKPQDFAMDMAMAYDPINSTPGVNSMHPTLYGDCYANFGWFGVFTGVFWSFFAFIADRIGRVSSNNIVNVSLFVSYAYAFTLIARGAVYNGTYNIFFVFLTHRLLLIILNDRNKGKELSLES